jgi:SWI/SNF-related matrix-associated actin-dependent regulator of chromatin subfamily D
MFPYLPELLVRHLLPCDPIVLDYTIKVDKEHHYSTTAYDIDVELENPIRDRIKMITQRHGILQRELSVLDEQISAIVQSIHESKSKRDFMKSFSDDPVLFLNSWIGSQSRDLEVVLGDARLNREEVERSEFWTRDRIKESLFHYLSERGL